jgi:ABC-2 type transport system ATP-binding protein
MPVLETSEITRRFGDLVAVKKVSVAVEGGEVFGLLGPNGAGKTTLLKMLTTILPPSSGSATVAGFDIVRQAARVRRVIGYVPQMLSADGALTGYENLMVFAKLCDIPGRERDDRVRQALGAMKLLEVGDRLVRTYSGGMLRRLEVAQAMLHRPPVLFLDEPTVGLDPLARAAMWEHIRAVSAGYGTTIILTTHYMEEADSLCTRVGIMHLGEIAVIGAPAALKRAVGGDRATLEDVFVHYTGDALESGGSYRETSRTRRTARRLG